MLTKTDIEKFYQYLARLRLKKANATIAKATGYSPGNVSEYLNKKKEPSEAFIKKFYEAFPEGSLAKATGVEDPHTPYGLHEKYIETLERENRRLHNMGPSTLYSF